MSARPGSPSYDHSRNVAAAAILIVLLFAATFPLFHDKFNIYTRYIFLTQDAWLAPFFAAACLFRARPLKHECLLEAKREQRLVGACLALTVLICWAGRYLVFHDFDATPDERLVTFDAAIFRDGALVWPILSEWRGLADALNRKFMLPIGSAQAWISAYLPVNAAIHAAVGKLLDEDLTSPLLVAAGGFCLWRISLRQWPDSVGARVATFAFYVGSSQVLITGMTKFAMSSHLALNLCWLMLFLRGGRGSHALAIVVGFLATGLHQPLFHPLFVAPFLALLWMRRQRGPLCAYLLAYAGIGAFWFAWPIVMASLETGPVVPIASVPGVSYLDRLLATLAGVEFEGTWLTAANLIRFVTWQHPLLLPMALFGAWAAWRSEPLVRALAISFALPILVFWIVLPWQGSGWGYRYLHPVLGNAFLLGGWGWHMLERSNKNLWRPFLWTSAVSALLLLPLHGWMAHKIIRPIADADARLAAIDADVLIVDPQIHEVFVHNRHDLSNRPIRLIGVKVQPRQMAQLCRRRSIAFVEPPAPRGPSQQQRALRSAAEDAGCATSTVRVSMADHLLRGR